MSTEASMRPLRGIIPPMATPLSSMDELDVPGLESLIEHILGAKVHALFILGTTGEGPALSYRLRRELIERVCRQVGTRVPVLVGISDSAYAESMHLAEFSAKAGASSVVVTPPFYYQISQGDLLRLVERLAKDSSLPLYLYNQPALTKINFDPETVVQACEIPNIWGLKDSSGDIGYLYKVLSLVGKRYPDFSVLVGPEHLLAEALVGGAHGGVPGGANIFPTIPVRLYQAFLDGRHDEMHALQAQMVEMGSPIWNSGEEGSSYLRRLKCALSLLGICNGVPTLPYEQSTAEERREMEAALQKSGILPS